MESLKEQFARDGYALIKQLFTQEEVRQLKEEARSVIERHGIGREGVYVGLAAASPKFKEAAAHPRIVAALREVIGEHVIFLSDKLVYKNETTKFGSPWHQDYPYWEGSHKYSIWIALDDAVPDNGCLRVIPGSHLFGAVNHGGDATDGMGFANRLSQQEIDSHKIVDLPAESGDAIVFHDLLYHSSYPNQTGRDRWALISTYKDGTEEDPHYEWARAAFTVINGSP